MWMDNDMLDLAETELGGMDWTDVAQGSCEHDNEPSRSIKCCKFIE
jgi:hypothetical protein